MRYRRLGKTDVAFLSLIYWLIDFTWQDTHFSNKHYIYIALPVFFQILFLFFFYFFFLEFFLPRPEERRQIWPSWQLCYSCRVQWSSKCPLVFSGIVLIAKWISRIWEDNMLLWFRKHRLNKVWSTAQCTPPIPSQCINFVNWQGNLVVKRIFLH